MEEPTMHEPEWTDAELADLARPLKVLAARVVADCREFYEPLDVLLDNHHWQRLAPTWDDFCTQWIGQSQAWVLAIGDALDNETAPVGNEMVECLGTLSSQLSPEERYQFLVTYRPRRPSAPPTTRFAVAPEGHTRAACRGFTTGAAVCGNGGSTTQ